MKKVLFNSVVIFLLCFITHFAFDLFPNFITVIFSPVNESIFEHFKMLYSTSFIFSLISLLYKKSDNFFIKAYLRSMLSIIILAIIYLPVNYLFGEILPLTLIILFISIFITEIIIKNIPNKKHYKVLNIICAILLITNLVVFVILSYNPLHNYLFYDSQHKVYGLYKSK